MSDVNACGVDKGLEVTKTARQLVYSLPHDFDAYAVRGCKEELANRALDSAVMHVMNFRHVKFIDSSGIGAIVFLYKRLKANGKLLVMTGLGGQPADLIRVLRVDRVIPVYEDLDAIPKPPS